MERKNVFKVYDRIAEWFDQHRGQQLVEKKYLDYLISTLPDTASILDVGCGTGEPIFRYFAERSYPILGLDASAAMLAIARKNFPEHEFLQMDMRELQLDRQFDAILAWHSFFHLPLEDQKNMFTRFHEHLKPNGILLFTSGHERGEAWGENGGEQLFHASFSTQEYQELLQHSGFTILTHEVEDQSCGGATVWVAQRKV